MDSRNILIDDYFFHDPRLTLVPIEKLSPRGLSAGFAATLAQRCGWTAAHRELFNLGFSFYWERSAALAARIPSWIPPRLRHVGIVHEPWSVRPYIQILNTTAWLIYDSDVDPESSTPEFLAYLLVHGDRMTVSGEVTRAPVLNGAYWIERSDEECRSFIAATERSPRPDAEAFRALAAALPWMRQLAHENLRPPQIPAAHRSIPGTGLLVRKDLEQFPLALVTRWVEVANQTLARFRARQTSARPDEVARLCGWLAEVKPRLVICGQRERLLWDDAEPQRIGAVRAELKTAGAAALQDIAADLQVIDERTRSFHRALVEPDALPASAVMENTGYVYLLSRRKVIAYNLHEAGLERLQSPAIPYARAMLGARTIHEWCHLAVDAGWVPLSVATESFLALIAEAARLLDALIDAAPAPARARTRTDLDALRRLPADPDGLGALTASMETSPGLSLIRIILRRVPDYQANLLAQRFLSRAERETYVRQNVRELRSQSAPEHLWRMLARYLYEYQYLSFSEVEQGQEYFIRSTWFDADFFASGIMDRTMFATLADAIRKICNAFAVDEAKLKLRASQPTSP